MLRYLQKTLLPIIPHGTNSWMPLPLLSFYRRLSNDVCIVSYPCSGRTWLRLLIGKAVSIASDIDNAALWELHELPFYEGNSHFPRVTLSHDGSPFNKTPDELTFNRRDFSGRKVIFLARDPRDLIVSWYFEMKKRKSRSGGVDYPDFDGTLDQFLTHDRGSVRTIIAYFNNWMNSHSALHDFLLVRYEDLHTDPSLELERCLEFCGFPPISKEAINSAVDFAAFDNMRQMETEELLEWDEFKPGNLNDSESFKTRSGKVGDFRNHLTDESCLNLDDMIRQDLDPQFGYEFAGGRRKD